MVLLLSHDVVPRMRPDLLDGVPLLRISVQNLVEQVLSLIADVARGLEVGAEDLLVKLTRVGVFEREIAANQGE